VVAGLLASVGALLVATVIGSAWKSRNGTVRAMTPRTSGSGGHRLTDPAASAAGGLTETDIGAALGNRATLVQFSSAFCAPCRATRRILTDVASMVDGVAHVEIDAESRLDLVRRLDVRRTPTTLVLGPDGQITHRASGQPRKADVIAALGVVV